ncbi:uncharacterized protein bif [Fopius arisanus]|uniref:Uncharacterized protein bif n=2 Tax=Fopius arisanus TaxID=64838 RepID=A0A0C9R434_9HYME|nr:PREDICTED: uncharacterized protein LOC105267316 [Fopius arisanus]
MASINGNTGDPVPQWKRELIQRRKQQNRPPGCVSNISSSISSTCNLSDAPVEVIDTGKDSENGITDPPNPNIPESQANAQSTPGLIQSISTGGATGVRELTESQSVGGKSVACKMHLEANGSCPLEDTPKTLKSQSVDLDPQKPLKIYPRLESDICRTRMTAPLEDFESDSSEELQYGPGIVNKLKSKYLNLTLREMNKSRTSVQRFRRAASLEDLLDSDEGDKTTRKFTKKSPGVSVKNERYRNSSRGNDSMKRARSVETLMRYQSVEEEKQKFMGFQKDSNDHIVLIDRTTVNIESRLKDRPKPLNKPKRIKPLLADTERPPPDLVKTTMRIFEGSVKKLKPKGDVAVKVATFKTINDTFKAQTAKKIQKPPLQPKPFMNGGVKVVSKKRDDFVKCLEGSETLEKRNGVESETIVQSVSSVVEKFQKIEKSSSPEPNKFRFSPSPEPSRGTARAVPIVLCPLGSKRDKNSGGGTSEGCQEKLEVKDERESSGDGEDPEEEVKGDDKEVIDCESEGVDGDKGESGEIGEKGENRENKEERRGIFESEVEVIFEEMEKNCSGGQGVKETGGNSPQGVKETGGSFPEGLEDVEVNHEGFRGEKEPETWKEDKPLGAISSLGVIRTSNPAPKEQKCGKKVSSPIPKQIGIIRPLVSVKQPQPLSNREMEKNLINRVKNIEQPTKVVVSLKSAEEIQGKKNSPGEGAGSGLWDTKPWNQQNNTMVFNFSNRKDVPDYIENDGLIIRRKRDKPKVGDGGIIVLDATLDASTTDEGDWEMSRGPPSPCDVLFTNDNVLINGRSNLIRTPRNHKNRIQFNDDATRTFEYPSEASMLEDDASGETSAGSADDYQSSVSNKSTCSTGNSASPILSGGGLASYTPSKVDLTSDGFELGITRSVHPPTTGSGQQWETEDSTTDGGTQEHLGDSTEAAWGAEATADLLY